MSYALIQLSPLGITEEYDGIPNSISWPNGTVSYGITLGAQSSGYVFVNKITISNPPTTLHHATGRTYFYSAANTTISETTTYDEPILDTMRRAAKDRILAWRATKQDSGFTFANTAFQSDIISRTNIEGAVIMGLISLQQGQPYSVSWTATDNSQMTLDANTAIAFGVTAATTYQYWHQTSVALKDQIDTLTTAAEMQAVLDSIGA